MSTRFRLEYVDHEGNHLRWYENFDADQSTRRWVPWEASTREAAEKQLQIFLDGLKKQIPGLDLKNWRVVEFSEKKKR